jgi:hypothetical protein
MAWLLNCTHIAVVLHIQCSDTVQITENKFLTSQGNAICHRDVYSPVFRCCGCNLIAQWNLLNPLREKGLPSLPPDSFLVYQLATSKDVFAT